MDYYWKLAIRLSFPHLKATDPPEKKGMVIVKRIRTPKFPDKIRNKYLKPVKLRSNK